MNGTRAGSVAVLRWRWHRAADVVATVATVAITEVGLRSVGVRRLADRAGVRLGTGDAPVAPGDGSALPVWAQRRLRTVDRVITRWPFGDTCLRRTFVGAVRLRRLDPVLVIGVRLADDAVEAHAWLRIAGVDLDPEAEGFHELSPGR